MLPGSIGLLGSASLGAQKPGLFEPIHGSAPDIAGKNLANPSGTINSIAMLLLHGLHLAREGAAVSAALEKTLNSGLMTGDLGGKASCTQFTQAVVDALAA